MEEYYSPVRRTQILFCVLTALNLLRTLPAQQAFYRWFSGAGLEISRHRGFGQSACRAFGLLPAPPALTELQFGASGLGLAGCLLLSCTDLAPRALLLLGLGLYWLFFGQLYCEAHVGAHVTVLIPPMLIVCACAPDLTGGPVGSAASMLPLLVLKAVLASAYCAAGLAKLWRSGKTGRFWADGSTLQYYVFEALMLNRPSSPDGRNLPHWSFGVPSPCSWQLQRFLFQRPRLCALLSAKSIAFEACAPLVLLLPQVGPLFALAGVGFHYGIALFQNIDFVSWWGPFYAIFIWEDPAVTGQILQTVGAGLRSHPLGCGLVLAYLAVHLLGMGYCALTGHEILPLSSFHMFSEPKNLWEQQSHRFWYLTDKEHQTGSLKNYCFPFCRPQHVRPSELPKLPFRYLLICDRVGERELMGNIELSSKMQELVGKIHEQWNLPAKSYLDPDCTSRMLALLVDAKREFSQSQRLQLQIDRTTAG